MRGGTGHLGLTHTETQRGRLRTACGHRRVDSKNSQTTPATTSTSSIRQLLGAADAQTAHHATFSTAPTHQLLGSANAETTPARHWPQRPTERSDLTQHAKGRTGDCPGPRKGTITARHVTQGGGCYCPEPRSRPPPPLGHPSVHFFFLWYRAADGRAHPGSTALFGWTPLSKNHPLVTQQNHAGSGLGGGGGNSLSILFTRTCTRHVCATPREQAILRHSTLSKANTTSLEGSSHAE